MAKRTTIEMTDYVISLKDKLVEGFGLRNTISAGIVVLSQLTDEDLNKAILQSTGKSVGLDMYEDRKKLLRIRAILNRNTTQNHGYDISFEDAKCIDEIIGSIREPEISAWSKTGPSTKVEVKIQPSKLDDLKKALGPDDADPAKRIVDTAADETKSGSKRKTKDGSKPA